MQIDINSLKILSPSPTMFILGVNQSDAIHGEKQVTYIGSAEHCFEQKTLVKNKLAHSSIYSKPQYGSTTAYAVFDLNDVIIGADIDFNTTDETPLNYVLAPHLTTVSSKINTPIAGIVNNKNSFIGVVPANTDTVQTSSMLSRKFDYDDNRYFKYSSDKDAITLYDKLQTATNSKQILRVKDEFDVNNKFDQLFVLQTFNEFNASEGSLDVAQSIIDNWSKFVNSFDSGLLSIVSFITPKQTLNAEYSTTKPAFDNNLPYQYMRNYRHGDDSKFNMYASGNQLVFNYIESNRLVVDNDNDILPTQISTEYSTSQINYQEDVFGKAYNSVIIADEQNITDNYVYQHYMPEVVNVIDDSFSGVTGTANIYGVKTAVHKANIFDVDIKEKYKQAIENIPVEIANVYSNLPEVDPSAVDSAYESLKQNLKKHINDRLQALVAEIIPAHTHLFNVVLTETEDEQSTEPEVKNPFYIYDGELKIAYQPKDLPYSIIFKDRATDEKIELYLSLNTETGLIDIELKPCLITTKSSITYLVPTWGYGKYSGLYKIFVTNGELQYSLVQATKINHPFTVINGELLVTYDENNPPSAVLFADVANDKRTMMMFSKNETDETDTVVEINIEYTGEETDETNKCITYLTLTDTGTNPDEYMLYINDAQVIFRKIN